MTSLKLTLSLFVMTLLWGQVGYQAGLDAPVGAEPSRGDLLTSLLAITYTVTFGLYLWQLVGKGER